MCHKVEPHGQTRRNADSLYLDVLENGRVRQNLWKNVKNRCSNLLFQERRYGRSGYYRCGHKPGKGVWQWSWRYHGSSWERELLLRRLSEIGLPLREWNAICLSCWGILGHRPAGFAPSSLMHRRIRALGVWSGAWIWHHPPKDTHICRDVCRSTHCDGY